jgi:hypothetical protein
MIHPSSTDRPRMNCAVGGGLSVPKTTTRRRTIFAVILVLLIATPAFLFVAAVSNDSTLCGFLGQTTVFWFPLWAIIAVWVTLDASALYGFIGPRPDPFGPKALRLSALGFANVAAMFLFLLLTKGK